MDAERCINCTRCVRFTEEISETNQLTIVSRGDKNYPLTAPGKEFDDPYSLNTVDICPVGALTSADFRFRARVWEMSQTPSIDITNGKGCNVDLWTRDNLVLRITPRYNPEVNDYWMPDEGREAFQQFNENRISRPEIRMDGKNQVKTSWNNTFQTLGELMENHGPDDFMILGSPHASVESNYVLDTFFKRWGVSATYFTPHVIEGYGDDFLITDDQAPNTNGCRLLNLEEQAGETLAQQVKDSNPEVLWILADDLVGREVLDASDLESTYVIYVGRNYNDTSEIADLIVPITCAAEHAGSYVNIDGRIQRTFPAKETKYTDRRLNLEMSESRLDRYGTSFDNWRTEENKIDCIPAWDVMNNLAKQIGLDLEYESARSIIQEVAESHPSFKGVTYERMDEEYGIQIPLESEKVEQ
jgi:NADH-quinone oxidoreductase subunit G